MQVIASLQAELIATDGKVTNSVVFRVWMAQLYIKFMRFCADQDRKKDVLRSFAWYHNVNDLSHALRHVLQERKLKGIVDVPLFNRVTSVAFDLERDPHKGLL